MEESQMKGDDDIIIIVTYVTCISFTCFQWNKSRQVDYFISEATYEKNGT